MKRILLLSFLAFLISCTDRVAIDSTTPETYEISLNRMKQGLSEGEIFQLEFSLIAIQASSIPSSRNITAKIQDPKEYAMNAVHGKDRNQIIKLAKEMAERKANQFR